MTDRERFLNRNQNVLSFCTKSCSDFSFIPGNSQNPSHGSQVTCGLLWLLDLIFFFLTNLCFLTLFLSLCDSSNVYISWDFCCSYFLCMEFSSSKYLVAGTYLMVQWFSSVQSSRSVVSDSLRPHEPQYARPPCPSPTLGVHSDSRPSSQWCHPAISSSVVPFSSCPKSLPASESFPVSQLFTWGGQSIGVSASASVLPMNIQDWFPLWWTGWISLQCKGLSRVFSNTTLQKHQFFGTQLSSQSNSHIPTWPREKP